MRRVLALAVVTASLLSGRPASAAGYSDWAAIVVAGDWHAHSGAPSEVFDNARRDIAARLTAIGFSPDNVVQFSARPDHYPAASPQHSDAQTIANSLWDLSNRANGGCLAYFTSHGSPDGIVMDDKVLAPDQMASMVGNACGDKPTIVVVSACFSGVFVPALSSPNRMVLTAARPDRTSFGCGESDQYTFFDSCFLQAISTNGDFPDLANAVRACVAKREAQVKVQYPSDPQLAIGSGVASLLPHWR